MAGLNLGAPENSAFSFGSALGNLVSTLASPSRLLAGGPSNNPFPLMSMLPTGTVGNIGRVPQTLTGDKRNMAGLRSGLRNDINRQLGTAGELVKYEEIQVEGIYAVPYENCFYRVVVLEKIASSKSLVGHSVNGVATAAAVDEDCPTLPSVLSSLRAISSLPP
ncbi:hypothetical protein quinque_008759 [Culex quinquefasciatus]|uniref:Uncharacterized protein n=1 Tax=Culex pipiens pipiens TaxID=38569 RepID=A0ABD1DXK0_CULPP